MGLSNIVTVVISVLSSSIFTLVLSSLIFDPVRERKKYIFDEKKQVYNSIIVFAQIFLYPQEAKFSLHVQQYDIQKLSDEENIRNAGNDLKMTVPKLKLITKNEKVIEKTNLFIERRDADTFNTLVNELRKDLYKLN